jgi:hypothetical protein
MNRHKVLGLLLCCLLLFAAGCEQTSIAEQEQIKSLATLQASTPSPTPSPTLTPTLIPTATPIPTLGPSPTPLPPTVTPIASPTPLPPTATPNPALTNFSLCNQTAGDAAGGRFSARVAGITATVEPAFERIVIGLAVPDDSAPPHASARCLSAADYTLQSGEAASAAYLLQIDLNDWLHDAAFSASTLMRTQALSGTTVLKSIAYRFDPTSAAGATLAIAMDQPLPFRLRLQDKPAQLILEVAKTTPIGASSDMLSIPSKASTGTNATVYFLQDGDIWRYASGKATNISNSPAIETALAFSPAASKIAFCRAAPGAAAEDERAPSTLWTMQQDGSEQTEIASEGRACADPVFSPDGTTIAFSVDESGASPARLSIWSVPSAGGATQRLTPANDEWSRFGPQWLDNDQLIYAAMAEDGRSTLFLRGSDRQETDIGAGLVLGNRYRALGRPLVAPDGSMLAVEGLRANASGADLVLLDAQGTELNTIGGSYWTRPLAWNADGTLFYLNSACASDVALDYALHARTKSGDDTTIAAGSSLGGLGDFSAIAGGLAYVTLAHVPAGPRGPLAIDRTSAGTLWFWDVGGSGERTKLPTESQSAISALAP